MNENKIQDLFKTTYRAIKEGRLEVDKDSYFDLDSMFAISYCEVYSVPEGKLIHKIKNGKWYDPEYQFSAETML